MRKYAYSFLALLLLSGCAYLGIPSPETFNEKVAVAYSTITGVRNSATTLVSTGKISPEDAGNVLEQTDNAREGVEIARQIYASDPDGANTRLSSILIGLQAIDAYLRSRS